MTYRIVHTTGVKGYATQVAILNQVVRLTDQPMVGLWKG